MRFLISRLTYRLRLALYGVVGPGVLLGCVSNPAPSIYLDYQTKTKLTFPMTGEALIGTGGRTKDLNPDHIVAIDQRFALDILALAPGSSPPGRESLREKVLTGELKELYRGDHYHENSSHYCFGRQIIAPGDGIIADAKDGVQDNVVGERNIKEIPGNYVVIDHLNGEYSMLAHFMNGSVQVQKGESVRSGSPLGKCGNSGNSNLPHLHYHLQNTPVFFKGEGLPAQFRNYFANGKLVERGEPIQGEIISNVLEATSSNIERNILTIVN